LRIKVKDIYFLIGLLHQEEVVNLKSWEAGSGMKMEKYINSHCVVGTPKVGSQVPIQE
jgi:hypothetical protein